MCDCRLDPCECGRRGWYTGASAGYSDGRASSGALQGALEARGHTTTVQLDDTDVGWKIYGGYRFSLPIAAEVGLAGLDGFGSRIRTASSSPTLRSDVGAAHPITGRGITVAILGYPLEWGRFSAFGKLGAWFWDADVEVNLAGTSLDLEDEGVDPVLGLGVQVRTWGRISIRAEYERFYLDGDEVDLWSLGGVYRF